MGRGRPEVPIAFDETAANTLIASAGFAASMLRGQAAGRRGAVEHAAQDFAGGFARLFTAACVVESEDRGKLAGVLDDLVDQVREAKLKAQQEKERLEQVAAWQIRQTLRQQTDLFSLLLGSSHSGPVQSFVLYDPGPSQIPVAPPVISAPFSARERSRVAGGMFLGGRTSGDPEALRAFVTQSRGYQRKR